LGCGSHDLPLHAHLAADNRLRRSSLAPGDVVFRHVAEVVKPRDRVVEHQRNTTAAVRWVVTMGGDIIGVNAQVIHGNEIFAMSDCVLYVVGECGQVMTVPEFCFLYRYDVCPPHDAFDKSVAIINRRDAIDITGKEFHGRDGVIAVGQ
ncbi:hypothetical protein DYB37_012862, partial [Aphanomyces astaci]